MHPRIGITAALERARWTTWDREAFLLVPTKSHHHQCVAAIGDGLRETGWSVLDD